ncbi:MAG: bifunctional enoyl-CoA hydratase/phosphate acetyltransferase [Spirochaetales bacterium]|nr:bifunctional enoyl-CoA hydratase/phosphate acetyltransferase [Spirochaetales bacterium]MCF7938451.1 bifunctional enoyl-CoA hydratase/phosphate acetyltransferase [Spirochaetales bacterium]
MIRSFAEMEKQAVEAPSKRMAIAMAEESDVLKASMEAWESGIVEPVFVGDKEAIQQAAGDVNLDISNIEINQATGEKECASRAIELVRTGKADLVMKGRTATSTLMKAILDKENGVRGSGVLSHVSIISIKTYHKLLLMSDAALNIAPDLDTKASILRNTVDIARRIGIEKPKTAVIGAVEKVNTSMPDTIDAALLSKMAQRGQIKNCVVDGPFALDNAVSGKSCQVKGIESEVGGDADILLMPDIEAANVLYKAIAYLTDADIAGIIVGADVPIVLTSRADSDRIKFVSILAGVSVS